VIAPLAHVRNGKPEVARIDGGLSGLEDIVSHLSGIIGNWQVEGRT
jgi:hypothetical protein